MSAKVPVQPHADLDRGYAGRRAPGRVRENATIQGREFGRRLRKVHDEAGMTGVALAHVTGLSTTSVSRMLSGYLVPSVVEAAGMLALCGAAGEARDRILDLCDSRHDTGILRLSDGTQWDALAYHAEQACRLAEHQPLMIPWLVQTDDYAAVWSSSIAFEAPGLPLLASQKVDGPSASVRASLSRLPGRLDPVDVVVHECALRAPVGDSVVQVGQLRHLLHLFDSMQVRLWIIPAGCVLPSGAQSGFTILDFEDKPSVVFRADPTSGVFFDGAADVAVHREIVRQLRGVALPRQAAGALIERIADEHALIVDPAFESAADLPQT